MSKYTPSEVPATMVLPLEMLEITKEVVAVFDGGAMSSDGGMVILAAADEQAGVTAALAAAMRDGRQQSKVEHSAHEIVRERVLAIAGGYADGNDLNTLRDDPALKLVSGQCPLSGTALASQATVSRWENRATRGDLLRMGLAVAERVVAQLPANTQRVIVDVDASDDPCHGQQEFEGFNAYYDEHCYLPLFVHLTDQNGTQWPLGALLRPGRVNPRLGVTGLLKRAVHLLRGRFAAVEILVRADSGFGCDEILRCCERLGVGYLVGLPTNSRVKALGEPTAQRCVAAFAAQTAARQADAQRSEGARAEAGVTVSVKDYSSGCPQYDEFPYKAGSWERARDTVVKVEMVQEKLNPRYVVTNQWVWAGEELDAAAVYKLYCGRGNQENGIKEIKLDLASGRTSCHRFLANQARLLEHLTAHLLWAVVRVAAEGTRWAKAQVATMQLQIQKIAVRVCETTRRVWLHLCSTYPYQREWRLLLERLRTGQGAVTAIT